MFGGLSCPGRISPLLSVSCESPADTLADEWQRGALERRYSSCLMGDPSPSSRASKHSDESSALGDLYQSSSCLCGLTKDVHAHSFPFFSNYLLFNLTYSPSSLFSALILPLCLSVPVPCPAARARPECHQPRPAATSAPGHDTCGNLCPNEGKMILLSHSTVTSQVLSLILSSFYGPNSPCIVLLLCSLVFASFIPSSFISSAGFSFPSIHSFLPLFLLTP